MPVKRGDTGVWIGGEEPVEVLVGTISPSGKTMLVTLRGLDYIVPKKEVITMRQANNRGIAPESPTNADTAQEIMLDGADDAQPY